ncbi:MAG TPA: hypothetical protein VGR61_04440, partial [Candidatus Dormibacteraeota bacterium]|nr:hypothetical protein [Candidatus Dormibacteraeota bacterium]
MASEGGGLPPGAGSPLVPGTPQGLIVRAPGHRVEYLYGRKNLVAGAAALVVGLGLLLTGIAGALWPLVAVGVYAAAALAVPGRRNHALHPGAEPGDVREALAAQLRALGGKVPNDVYGKVAKIQASILALLPRVEHLPAGSEDLFIVR